MTYPHIDRVINHLYGLKKQKPELRVYAILDAARNEKIYPALIESMSDRDFRCLYAGHQLLFLGKMPRVLAGASPYLVKLQPRANFTRWLISRGWSDSWGIFCVSSSTLDELLHHFRRFLMVKDESGKALYLRYYDPRVLRVYLPSCNDKELSMVFGPVERYYVEGEESNTLIEYSRGDSMLDQNIIHLTEEDRL